MGDYRVVWAPSAVGDLKALLEYIGRESSVDIDALLSEFREKAASLEFFPERGRIVPELRSVGINRYRELLFKRWRLIYRFDGEEVRVLIVADMRRDLEALLYERLTMR
jgi:plasmid stabilization system protein ParE